MAKVTLTAVILSLAAQVLAEPPLVSVDKNGEVGVNFGGYHASAGLGGSLDGGASGGLHAEAGTPHGQEAHAGLAGRVESNHRGLEDQHVGNPGNNGIAFAEAHSIKHSASAAIGGVSRVKDNVNANSNAQGWASPGDAANGGFQGYIHKSYAPPLSPQEKQVLPKKVPSQYAERRFDIPHDRESPAKVDTEYSTKIKLGQRSPTFFTDIFNIPIQALSSVSRLVGNAVSGTNISIEKSAYAHADKGTGEATKTLNTDTAVQINTPAAASVVDDIFAIPINTLSAVNKFLENNVPARRKLIVQTQVEAGTDEPTQIRLKGKARRRAARRPIIIQESSPHPQGYETPNF